VRKVFSATDRTKTGSLSRPDNTTVRGKRKELGARTILRLGHPGLRTNCEQVRTFGSPRLEGVIRDLEDTLGDFRTQNGFGRGIAAPQINEELRIIVINIDHPIVLCNPRITSRSRKMMTLWDDCFSFPDLVVKVRRHLSVAVRFQDATGKQQRVNAAGALSELLQHEIDHLNGILCIDRAIDSRHIMYRSEFHRLAGKTIAGTSL
jgi:peptide deformylase